MRELKWYVAYTNSRFEKKVHLRVQQLGVKSFLPLCKIKRQWSDRVKLVEVPLFSSYVFVKTTLDKIPRLMGLNGIARFLSFDGKLATVKDEEIELIEKVVDSNLAINVQPQLPNNGQKVRIIRGVFMGLEGILIRKSGKNCLVISIDGLNQDLFITMPNSFLETIIS